MQNNEQKNQEVRIQNGLKKVYFDNMDYAIVSDDEEENSEEYLNQVLKNNNLSTGHIETNQKNNKRNINNTTLEQ